MHMYVIIYHVLISALSAHMIHINLNTIFCTHIEHSPTKTIYIYKVMCVCVCGNTHTDTMIVAEVALGIDISWSGNAVRRGRFSVWL